MKPTADVVAGDSPATQASHAEGRVTGWTTAALLGVMWAGIPWMAPIAAAAPLAFELRPGRPRLRTSLVIRWVATVGLAGLILIGLIGARAVRTVPFGPAGAAHTVGWLDGTGSAPPGPWAMLAASAVFVIAAASTRGLLGCVVLAGVVLRAAVIASVVLARSNNVFEATVAAFPLWTLLWVAAMTAMLAPLSAWGAWRRRPTTGLQPSRRLLFVVAALVATAVLLRLGAAAVYTDLARHLTAR